MSYGYERSTRYNEVDRPRNLSFDQWKAQVLFATGNASPGDAMLTKLFQDGKKPLDVARRINDEIDKRRTMS